MMERKVIQRIVMIFILYPLCLHAISREKWSMEGFLVVEDVTNFTGGIQPGSVFNGVYHPILNLNLENFQSTASARIGILAITYTRNQDFYTNASQNVSNLSAQREVRLAELNYNQKLTSWSDIRIGIMDMREYLNAYDVPKQLINSGFGTDRVMGNSTNVATYPYPGFGTILDMYKENEYGLSVGLFQGDPQHQSSLFHAGFFVLEELYWQDKLNVMYKPNIYFHIGTWQYYQPDPVIGFSNVGMYLMGQIVWVNASHNEINIFGQIGYGPNQANNLPYSVTIGSNISRLIPCRPKDIVSLGFSQVWLRNARPEKVFEANYHLFIIENVFLKPDLQYIIRPNGNLPNAWAGILRLVYNFNGRLLQKH